MLEIFALCSCACLACLWCAIALELTKDKHSRKKFDEVFGTNCLQCSKDRGGLINAIQCNNNHVQRNTSNMDTPVTRPLAKRRKHETQEKNEGNNNHRKDVKRKNKKKLNNSHRQASNSKLAKPNFLNSVSFPYLHANNANNANNENNANNANNGYANNGYAINGMPIPILPCKVCCRVKNGCECGKNNENIPTFDLTVHNCSCPNLNYHGQQQHINGSPVRLSYYSMTFDPYQRTPITNIPNINNIPYLSNIPKVIKNNIPNGLNGTNNIITNIPNNISNNIPNNISNNIPNINNMNDVNNIWKGYAECYKKLPSNFKRKRYFPRKLMGRRNYL